MLESLFDKVAGPKQTPTKVFFCQIFVILKNTFSQNMVAASTNVSVDSVWIYTYIYIYTKIKKPKTRCVRVNIKQKNTFSIVTNISVVLHNLLKCGSYLFYKEHFYKQRQPD